MKRDTPHPFGQVVIKARKKRKLSAYALAKRLGKTPPSIRVVERGDSSPKVETIIEYAIALDMEPWDLFKELVFALNAEEKKRKRKKLQEMNEN